MRTKSKPESPARLLAFAAVAVLLGCTTVRAQSSGDLWDVTQGLTVTAHSPLLGTPYRFDIRSMFGLTLAGGTEPTSVIFADGNPPGTVEFVEWRAASPVTVTQVVVYAQGQDASWDYAREYQQVTVLAKAAGAAHYDVVLLSSYRRFPLRVDLTVTDIPLVTAQEFRAEFIPYPTTSSGPPYGVRNGCRVIELDAFGTVGAPPVSPPLLDLDTYAGIRLEGTPGRTYQIEYASGADSTNWIPLTNLVLPSTPITIMDPAPASDQERYYRAMEIPFP